MQTNNGRLSSPCLKAGASRRILVSKIFPSFVLIVVIWFNAVFAYTPNLILQEPHHFAEAHSLSTSPFESHAYSEQVDDILTLNSFAIFPISILVPPLGGAMLGAGILTATTLNLMRKIKNLNRMGREYTCVKAFSLYRYVGIEGLELLPYYLRAPQKVLDIKTGVTRFVTVLDYDGQRSKDVDTTTLRDIVHAYVRHFAPSSDLKSKDYEEDLDQFLRQMGVVVFTDHTREHFLFELLKKEKILDKDNTLLKNKNISSEYILKLLQEGNSEGNIKDAGERDSIVHDLGMLAPSDVADLRISLEQSLNKIENKDSLQQDLVEKKNFNLFSSSLSALSHKYYREDPKISNLSKLSILIETLALSSIVNKEELKIYMTKSGLDSFKKFKNSSEKLLVLKLAYLDRFSPDKFHYFDLEKSLGDLKARIQVALHSKDIKNNNFQIVHLRGEEIRDNSLAYVSGAGFFSKGVLTGVLEILIYGGNVSATSLSAFLSYFSLVFGGYLVLKNSFQFIAQLNDLMTLNHGQKLMSVLDAYLIKSSSNLKAPEKKNGNKNDLNALKHLRFDTLSSHFINKIKQRLLTTQLKLTSIWIGWGFTSVLAGVIAVLILSGVAVAVSATIASGAIGVAYTGVATLLAMMLMLRELRLKHNVDLATDAKNDYAHGLDLGNEKLVQKQKRFLDLFMSRSQEMMKIGMARARLNEARRKICDRETSAEVESDLVNMFKARKKAIHEFAILNQAGELDPFIEHQLSISPPVSMPIPMPASAPIALRQAQMPYTVNDIKNESVATSYINATDVILDSLHPGVEESKALSYLYRNPPLPIQEEHIYWKDIHLSHLFSVVYLIYKDIKKTIAEHSFLLRKQDLQMRLFDQPLQKSEIDLLKKKIHQRIDDIHDLINFGDIADDQVALWNLHPTLSEEDLVPWSYSLLDELKNLKFYLLQEEKSVQESFSLLPQVKTLNVDEVPIVKSLIETFLPLPYFFESPLNN